MAPQTSEKLVIETMSNCTTYDLVCASIHYSRAYMYAQWYVQAVRTKQYVQSSTYEQHVLAVRTISTYWYASAADTNTLKTQPASERSGWTALPQQTGGGVPRCWQEAQLERGHSCEEHENGRPACSAGGPAPHKRHRPLAAARTFRTATTGIIPTLASVQHLATSQLHAVLYSAARHSHGQLPLAVVHQCAGR